mmetsp:Transcript_96443/g.267972  ORF Transcript_96443/g.267972 Transcript_96443/m.267972 type:complete len:269 (-) Transcript_96443:783-1589(-)
MLPSISRHAPADQMSISPSLLSSSSSSSSASSSISSSPSSNSSSSSASSESAAEACSQSATSIPEAASASTKMFFKSTVGPYPAEVIATAFDVGPLPLPLNKPIWPCITASITGLPALCAGQSTADAPASVSGGAQMQPGNEGSSAITWRAINWSPGSLPLFVLRLRSFANVRRNSSKPSNAGNRNRLITVCRSARSSQCPTVSTGSMPEALRELCGSAARIARCRTALAPSGSATGRSRPTLSSSHRTGPVTSRRMALLRTRFPVFG